MDAEAYSSAALDDLFGKIPFLNGVLGDIQPEVTARVRKRIAEKREWVASLDDRRWRRAYNKWLDHAEYCCDRADRYREERPAQRARSERTQAEWRRAREAARVLMRENPPKPGPSKSGSRSSGVRPSLVAQSPEPLFSEAESWIIPGLLLGVVGGGILVAVALAMS